MSNITRIKDVLIGSQIGTRVKVGGWVRTRRDSKAGFSFISLNDGSCFSSLQIVADNSLPNYQNEILRLSIGSSITAEGEIVESQGSGQRVEMKAGSIFVNGFADPENYPLQKKKISLERLREIAHLRPRTNTFGAISRLRNALAMAIHAFFQERGFLYLNTPIITTGDCEGAGELFKVTTLDLNKLPKDEKGLPDFKADFFGEPAYLTVSGQLEAESHACALGRVYTFGPTFRAENSNTRRHLAEFWMVEPEMAFADLSEDADLAVEFIRYLTSSALEKCQDDLRFFNDNYDNELINRIEKTASKPFERITYTQAVDIMKKSGRSFEFPVEWGMDLQSEHERALTEIFGGGVVVTDFPASVKPFYMRMNDDNRTVAAMDVLVPEIGEIIGGSQREERIEMIEAAMKNKKMDMLPYEWYLDLRRFGTVPHAGFGLGFERFVQYCSGMHNIRDVIPFPRTPGNAKF